MTSCMRATGVFGAAAVVAVATSHGYWDEGQPPHIVSVRLRLDDMDWRAKAGK